MTYYQWTTGKLVTTPECSKELGCPRASHNVFTGVYWAWDRSLGAWVHYAR